VLTLIAQNGVKVNFKDADGCSPLLYAAINGYGNVVRLLVAQDDIEVDFKDTNGFTPLCYA
jgi:ankyrin repeat protein